MYKKITIITVALLTVFSIMHAAAPKREFRGSWISTAWALDWPKDDSGNAIYGTSADAQAKQKAALVKLLESLKNDGFNVAFFQVRPMCDAFYKSSYVPWSSYLSGSRGTDPGWDPLEYAIEEAHKRGIELHAWLNPYRWSSSASNNWSTSYDMEFRNSGMLVTEGSLTCLNPGLQSVIDHIVNVTKEICANYKVDGIVFDDYFYPNGMAETSSAADYQLYKDSGTTMTIGNWRRANVNKMVQAVYDAVKATRPEARFGISPAGVAKNGASAAGINPPSIGASDWQYSDIYSDPIAWVHDGSLDYISPQIYWATTHSTAPFGPLTKWWSETAARFNRHHYASHSISALSSSNTESNWKEYGAQMELSRQYTQNNAPGCVFFRQAFISGPLKSGFGAWLKSNEFERPALAPEITWRSTKEYSAPTHLVQSGNTLTWDRADNGELLKYTVYAVPASLTLEQAQSADGDGISNQYLLGITYEPSYTLPDAATGNYWYAVCVYTGLGKEFAPSVTNIATETSPKVTLQSPVKGAKVEWYGKFAWSAVENGSYTLQIAADNSFGQTVVSHGCNTATVEGLDLTALAPSKVYYWRVKCSVPGCLESVSDVETFTTPVKDPAPAATLISPAADEDFCDNITFVWNQNGAPASKLQIAVDASFAQVVTEREGTASGSNLQAKVAVKSLGTGAFYWRVLTSGAIYTDNSSEVRRFTISNLPTGDYEDGYIVKKDPAEYTSPRATLTNLWMRSVKSEFNNFTQNNNGAMNRGMAIAGGMVLLSERESASSTTATLLRKYDLFSGENIGTITLDENVNARYMPVNDVITDSKGNVCVSNLTINAANDALILSLVNLEDGSTTRAASVNTTESARIDHCAVTGDVAAGNFVLYAAVANSNKVYRWTYSGGTLQSTATTTLREFSPASASSIGIAPRVIPVDDERLFIVGGNTALACYDFESGRIVNSFPAESELFPKTYNANGGDYFSLDDTHYVVYPLSDHSDDLGFRYNVVSTDATYSLTTASLVGNWTLPAAGFGNVNATVMGAVAQHVVTSDKQAVIVLYVPGNGMAAYQIDLGAGVSNISGDTLGMTQCGRRVSFSDTAAMVEIYDLSGALVARHANVEAIHLDLCPGAYILRAGNAHTTITKKIVVR